MYNNFVKVNILIPNSQAFFKRALPHFKMVKYLGSNKMENKNASEQLVLKPIDISVALVIMLLPRITLVKQYFN
jgi:hypothetical protein